MTDTVKFVEETDDAWIYEGLAIPYGGVTKSGQDLTGSHFTKDTDLCLDWFPEAGRPALYRHGFDPEVKAAPVGREIGAVREDSKGRWYRIQVEKAKAYASEVKQLLDEGLLSLSSGAVDHLTTISAKTGEITRWPWVEISFVPNPANPEALLYPVKSADAIEHLTIVDTLIPDAMKAEEAAEATFICGATVPEDEPVEYISTPETLDTAAVAEAPEVIAIRDGRRNSATDTAALLAAHDHLASVLSLDCASMAKAAPPAPRLVITGTAAAKDEPDLSALKEAMTVVAIEEARKRLHIG